MAEIADGQRRIAGIAFACLAALCFTMVDAIAKYLAPHLPTAEIMFFRGLFALLPVLYLVHGHGGIRAIRTGRPVWHLLRASFAVLSLFAAFFAVGRMPLADVIAIAFAAPLFVTGLSVLLLGERVGIHRWSAVIVGFVGVIIMVRPGAQFDWVALVALGGTLAMACAAIVVRHMSSTERSVTIVFYHTAATILAAGVMLPAAWVMPSLADWPWLIAIGVVGGAAQLMQTEAYRRAPVSTVVPFQYTAIIWAVLIGYAAWGDAPDLPLLGGATLVVASVLYVLHRETRRRSAAARPGD